jgi:flagellar basal body-associated protein FliL
MADHYVERTERDSGTGAGMVIGIVVLLLVAVMALFFVFGGNRGTAVAPQGQTNVNVPAQQQPNSGPNIQVPRQIDVNVNQPPAQQAPAQQAPAQQAPAGGTR